MSILDFFRGDYRQKLKSDDTEKSKIKKEKKEVVKKETLPTKEEITDNLVMDYCNTFLAGQLNEKETKQFLSIAKAFQLNPFKREIYCVPYNTSSGRKLSIITGYENYLKRAYVTNKIDFWKTEILKDNIGIYAKIIIKRKDWSGNFEHSVYMQEYNTSTNPLWKSKPYTMLKKVVTAQGFRLCFPEEFGDMPYTNDELPDEMTKNDIEKNPENENILKKAAEDIKKINELPEKTEPKPDDIVIVDNKNVEIKHKKASNKITVTPPEEWNPEKAIKEILDKARPCQAKLTKQQIDFFVDLLHKKDYTKKEYEQDIKYVNTLIETLNKEE